MPEVRKPEHEELNELREKVKALEAELSKERKEKQKEKKDKGTVTEALETATDEFNKLSRGFFFAGLESLAVAADMTRTFVDKTTERNSPEHRETITKMMTNLPIDMAKGFIDALDESAGKTEKIVDKFYEKYKEK